VTEITKDAVLFSKGGAQESVKTDMVLMAVGRVPNLCGIDTQALGIAIENGAIAVDDTMRTSVDTIYAIGDVNGKSMLAHTASEEGIVAVNNICGNEVFMDYKTIPGAVYIQPEIASVGLTEEEAKKQYNDIKVGRFPLAASGKAKVEDDDHGLVKVIAEARYGEVLGVHMYCPHATEMIAESVLCMNLEGTAEEAANAIHPHPSISETVQEAMRAAFGKAIHFG
jgi:dihydrolipoamide dehydrogenase